jgi:hypothetical protein
VAVRDQAEVEVSLRKSRTYEVVSRGQNWFLDFVPKKPLKNQGLAAARNQDFFSFYFLYENGREEKKEEGVFCPCP